MKVPVGVLVPVESAMRISDRFGVASPTASVVISDRHAGLSAARRVHPAFRGATVTVGAGASETATAVGDSRVPAATTPRRTAHLHRCHQLSGSRQLPS